MAGLRERKKAEAMRRIQHAAVGLFRERGFDQVTVEQVAEAAETSPSTIYRYFGTKEGLILHDEYDDLILQVFSETLRGGSSLMDAVVRSLGAISEGHFVRDQEETLYRVDLWMQHRGVQAAAGVYLLTLTEQVGELISGTGEYSPTQGRFIAAATINGFIAAIASWYAEGATRPAEEYVLEGVTALTRALSDVSALGTRDN